MRAVVVREYGGTPVLAEVPTPQPGPGVTSPPEACSRRAVLELEEEGRRCLGHRCAGSRGPLRVLELVAGNAQDRGCDPDP
jgi:hypothetical protein